MTATIPHPAHAVRTPRVAVLTSSWPRHPRDVAGRFVSDLVQALPVRAHVLCPDDGAHGPPAVPDVSLSRFDHPGVFYGPGAPARLAAGGLPRGAALRAGLSMLGRALPLARRVDLVFSHWAVPAGLTGALCRRLTGRPHVLLLHSGDVHWLETRPGGVALAGHIAAGCDALCAVSAELATRFEALAGRRPAVLGCGAPDGRPHRGGGGVGVLSRLVPGKGLRRLLHTWRDVDLPLAIAGDGPLAGELTALAATRPGVRLIGPLVGAARDDWLAGLDVALCPATRTPWGQSEGRPTAVVAARLAGLPVVAFADSLPVDLARHERDAWLVPGDEAAGLVAAVRRLAAAPGLRRRLGSAARRAAAPEAHSALVPRWMALFHGLLARGRLPAEARPAGAAPAHERSAGAHAGCAHTLW